MKIPRALEDELLKSFIVETNTLPQMAAAQARRQRQKRLNIIRIVAALVILLSVAGIWFSKQTSTGDVEKDIASNVKPSEPAKSLPQQSYVKAYQAGEAVELSVPPDVSEREKMLLTELAGVPLLIVKNDAGEISRIHIFER